MDCKSTLLLETTVFTFSVSYFASLRTWLFRLEACLFEQSIIHLLYYVNIGIAMFSASGGRAVKTTDKLWNELVKKDEYKAEFISKWRELQLDFCISPTFVCPAPLSKHVGKLHSIAFFFRFYFSLSFGSRSSIEELNEGHHD